MTKAIALTYSIAHDYSIQIAYSLLAACLLLAVAYGFNVYGVISHTVALQHVELETASLSSSVSSLDAQYLNLSSGITPAIMQSHGFTQGHVSAYIPLNPSVGRVAMTGNEL